MRHFITAFPFYLDDDDDDDDEDTDGDGLVDDVDPDDDNDGILDDGTSFWFAFLERKLLPIQNKIDSIYKRKTNYGHSWTIWT